MGKQKEKSLNYYHLVFLIQQVMVGLGLTTLPHSLSSLRYGIWIYPLLYGVIIQCFLWLYISLSKRYPDLNFFEITKAVLGRKVGLLVNFIFVLYTLSVILEVSRGYVQLVQVNTLSDHDMLELLFGLYIVVAYIGSKGIDSIARFCITSFFITSFMLIFLQWPFMKGEFIHLLPIIDFGWGEISVALKNSHLSFLGFELILFYYPYLIHKKKALKYASIGSWISIFIYFLVCLASAVYFNQWQLRNLLYPTLTLFKAVELSFLERIENLGITLWVFLVITTVVGYLWVFRKGVSMLIPFNKINKFIIFIPLIFTCIVVKLPFHPVVRLVYFEKANAYLSLFALFIPFIVLFVDTLRKRFLS